jgi:hypothetical protein
MLEAEQYKHCLYYTRVFRYQTPFGGVGKPNTASGRGGRFFIVLSLVAESVFPVFSGIQFSLKNTNLRNMASYRHTMTKPLPHREIGGIYFLNLKYFLGGESIQTLYYLTSYNINQ